MFKLNKEKLLSIINEKWTTKTCPMCSCNSWIVDDSMVTPLEIGEKKDLRLGGKMMPLVPVTCTNCGNTVFVNPLIIQAVDTDSDDTK